MITPLQKMATSDLRVAEVRRAVVKAFCRKVRSFLPLSGGEAINLAQACGIQTTTMTPTMKIGLMVVVTCDVSGSVTKLKIV